MWQMLLNYLPKNKAAEQLQELKKSKIEYQQLNPVTQKIETKFETHYDFNELINAIKNYSMFLNDSSVGDFYKLLNIALLEVGLAQRNVPVHVANEYCSVDQEFYHRANQSKLRRFPFDDKKTLPRVFNFRDGIEGSCYFFNPVDQQQSWYNSWFPLIPKRGIGYDFSIVCYCSYRPGAKSRLVIPRASRRFELTDDLAAIIVLCETRTKEFHELKEILLNPTVSLDEKFNIEYKKR